MGVQGTEFVSEDNEEEKSCWQWLNCGRFLIMPTLPFPPTTLLSLSIPLPPVKSIERLNSLQYLFLAAISPCSPRPVA